MPICRDCADFGHICPYRNLPCDQAKEFCKACLGSGEHSLAHCGIPDNENDQGICPACNGSGLVDKKESAK